MHFNKLLNLTVFIALILPACMERNTSQTVTPSEQGSSPSPSANTDNEDQPLISIPSPKPSNSRVPTPSPSFSAPRLTPADAVNPKVTASLDDSEIFYEPIEVQLSSDQPGTIYYTLDGSDPDTHSQSGPNPLLLTLEESSLIKVFSINETGLVSSIETYDYRIDPVRSLLLLF